MLVSIIRDLVAFMVALGLIITVHEFGHFFAARCCGVQVERFSFGFGRPIFRYSDRYGTEFVISLIPFGGYIRLFDKNKGTFIDPEINYLSLKDRNTSRHIAIVVAGPVANFVFAFFSYWVALVIGVPSTKPIIGAVIPNSIAASAKITSGMEIKEVDGIETNDWDAVRMQLITKVGSDRAVFNIALANSDKRQDKIIDLRQWIFRLNKEDPITTLGILPYNNAWIEPVLAHVQLDSAACKAGLQAGDKLIKVNDQFITHWMVFVDSVSNNPGKPLVLYVERKGSPLSLTLVPDAKLAEKGKIQGFAGVSPTITNRFDENKIIRKYGLVGGILEAANRTWRLIKLTLQILWKLILGDVKLNALNGPISIAQGAGASAKFGIIYYLIFLATISVNIGIINLFPLPILDGGHLLFLLISKAKRNPVSEKIQDISYRISFLILMFLILFVLFNDFSRILAR